MLDDESPISTNLGNDHGFIIKEYYLHWNEAFWETQSKAMRAYAQSGQYHTIVESRVHLTLVFNLFVNAFNEIYVLLDLFVAHNLLLLQRDMRGRSKECSFHFYTARSKKV